MKSILKKVCDIKQKFWTILNSRQKKQGYIVLVLITIGALFEMLGVSAIVPLINALMTPDVMMEKEYIKVISKVVPLKTAMDITIFMALFVVAVYVIKNVYLLISNYVKIRYWNQVQKDLSVYLLKSYVRRPYLFFLDANTGDILRGITNDVVGVSTILDNILKTLAEGITVIFIMIYIIYTDVLLAGGVILLAGVSLLAIVMAFRRKMREMGEEQREAMQIKYQSASHVIGGIKDIKVMKREEQFVSSYEEAYERQRITDTNYSFAGSCPERLIEAVCVCGLIGMVCLRIQMGADLKTFIPTLAGFAMAAFRILPSVSRIAGYINGVIYFLPTLDATYENVEEAKKYERSDLRENPKYICENAGGQEELVVKDITWKYPNSDKKILDHVSLDIRKGEAIAFIGASGAGKTTLADILLGLFTPQEGNILWDNKDIHSIPQAWSKIIGYVPQTVYLVDDTIRNNVLFGLEKEADDEKVWKALEMAQLKEFVEALPQKLDTVVGERGVKFSGGQRQRIAIARALYYDPEILVLDEATSALDTETENAVMEAIDSLSGFKTLIIVAHRLTTIRNCDRIYEIKAGKAVLCDKNDIFSES